MDVCRLELGRVRDELRKGRQASTNLLGLIRQQKHLLSTSSSSSLNIPASSDLVVKIVDSFSNSLSMLADCHDPAGTGSRKSPSLSSGGRRNKLRKGDLWTQVRITTDGYAWKKYGQKSILNAKHPSPSSFGDKDQPDSSINAPPLLGIMEWSPDDLDYLLGSVEFNDHQAF